MTRPPTRPRAWGAPLEPCDAREEPAHRDDEGPRRGGPPPKATGSLPPITLALGLIVLVFGAVVVARRWKWVKGAYDLHRLARGAREALSELAELAGMPAHGLGAVATTYEGHFWPLLLGGALGVLAGVIFVFVGGLVLLRNPLAAEPGARGVLVGAVVFALAHLGDVRIGYRTVALVEDASRQTREALGGATMGGSAIGDAMAGAYGRMMESAAPSHWDYLIEVLLWVVPTLVVAVWASRHLESPEVRAPLGLR